MNAGVGVVDPNDIVHALDENGMPVSTDPYGDSYDEEASFPDEGMYDDIQTEDTGAWSSEGIDMGDMDPNSLAAAGHAANVMGLGGVSAAMKAG